MPLVELVEIVPPPANPIEICDEMALQVVQDTIGITFPSDYCEFSYRYGSGVFRDESIEISVFNPCAPLYLDRIRDVCEHFRGIKNSESIGHYVPYDVFPVRPGLFPWGCDINGNDLFWLTNGAPDDWPVVVRAEGHEFERVDLPMSTFLARSFTRKVRCLLWSQEGFFPDSSAIAFEPRPLTLD